MEPSIEIRLDDVLISQKMTLAMKKAARVRSLFEHFKIVDEFLEQKDLRCILAIVAEGLEVYPEWIEYIRKRQHRYQIEMHCYKHDFYHYMSEEDGYYQLFKAKVLIEDAFNTRIQHWYPPFGKKYFPTWGPAVCERLGIQFNARGGIGRHYYFHYWNSQDRKRLKNLYELHGKRFLRAS